MHKPLLPERPGETDEERRLREALDRIGGQFLTAVDSAMRLRTAPQEARRARSVVRARLIEAALNAQLAHALSAYSPHDAGAAE